MFNQITMEIKLVIGGVILVLLAIGGGMYWYRGKQLDTLKTTNAVQKVVNGSLQDTVEKDTASASITEQTVAGVVESEAKTQTQHAAIAQQLQRTETAIVTKYHAAPVTATTTLAKNNELSQARLQSLWQDWCVAAGTPKQPECAAAP